MKNKLPLLRILIFVFLTGCVSDSNVINITLDNLNGLKEGAKVIFKGKEIGSVANIQLIGQTLNAELELQKEFQVPKGSEFTMVSMDLIGTRAISIKMGNEAGFYTAMDTLICIDKSATKLDSTIMHINNAIDEIKDSIPKMLNQ